MDTMDLKVSGITSMPGGTYGTVSISGSGQIMGDLHARMVDCSGAAKVLGDVTAERLYVSGAGKIQGNAQATEVDISGAAKVEGNLIGAQMKVSGAVEVQGNLRGQQLTLSGAVAVGTGIEAEEVYLDGVLQVQGLLNAEHMECFCGPTCEVEDIGCAELVVRKCKRKKHLFEKPGAFVLKVHSIEGDRVDLEYTKADVIRAGEVRLGVGCRVRRVEYSGTCQAEPGTVEELVKIGPAEVME